MTQARPLVWAARKVAYQRTSSDQAYLFGTQGNTASDHPARRRKTFRGYPRESGSAGTAGKKGSNAALFWNLYGSIGAYPNKKNKDYRYVVIGTRKETGSRGLNGAYYARMQQFGSMQNRHEFVAKRFIKRANERYGDKVSKKAFRAINKEVNKILNELF